MATCAKILLFIFNLIFVILGIILIVSGILATTSDTQNFDVITTDNAILAPLSSVGVITIIIGVLVFVIAFCGCCGAIKESKLLLTVFIVALCILLVLEIAGAIVGFLFRGKVDMEVTDELMQGLGQYNYLESNTTGTYAYTWDKVQKEGMCCGVSGPADWKNATGASFGPDSRETPMSCMCTESMENAPCSATEGVWTLGCKDDFINAILGNLAFSAGACVVIILAEVFGIIFACCVIRDADKETA